MGCVGRRVLVEYEWDVLVYAKVPGVGCAERGRGWLEIIVRACCKLFVSKMEG